MQIKAENATIAVESVWRYCGTKSSGMEEDNDVDDDDGGSDSIGVDDEQEDVAAGDDSESR